SHYPIYIGFWNYAPASRGPRHIRILDSQSKAYVTISPSTMVVLAHMCHMNPTALGTLMDNEFQDQVKDDLNISSSEPATKSDLRNLALRLELRIVKSESKLTDQMNSTAWKFVGITAMAMVAILGATGTILGVFLNSILK
ncbi:MAG: hypothetical protein WCH38_06470, partial [Actinomycetota bacterium]